jgi:hypothetical protein
MPMITNQQMRKALTIVIDMAKQQILLDAHHGITDKYDEQQKAIELVEHLRDVMFMHNLTRAKDEPNA